MSAEVRWSIVVPVKGTPGSKSRLGSSPELATAIALDTVEAASAVGQVFVVTAAAADEFRLLGAQIVPDPGAGLTAAVSAGVRAAGEGAVAVLLGDLPALTSDELRDALSTAAEHESAFVPDADDVGSVLVTALDAAALVTAFGEDSRAAHRAAGHVELAIAPGSGLRRDVDTSAHLGILHAAGRLGRRTEHLADVHLRSADTASAVRAALERARAHRSVSQEDAQTLLGARGDDLEKLLDLASSLRDEGLAATGRAGVITYSKKVFVPITKLCRDRCHYCIFVDTPGGLAAKGESTFMEPEEILAIAREGAALGCKEALFTLGDRPEDRWPVARAWLDEHGYSSTIEYIRAMAIRVTEETGLLCHLNPGVMSWAELQRLRPVAPSMGMMLETTAARLWSEKGGVHYGSPDKDPALRLRVIDDAGRARVPFTTGVLLGIGENDAERAEALFAIRASHERFGHVQETIVQNFRAKPRTAMQNEVDLELQEYVASVAVARLVMGPVATIQAPPNLTDAQELGLLIRAGIDDWGGVSPLTADHVNPERPWPNIDDLATLTRACGYELRERLTAHPNYLADPDTWIDERLRPHLDALTDRKTLLAVEDAPVIGRPYGPSIARASGTRTALIARAAADPAGLSDEDYLALLAADGPELDALAALADDLRREAAGDDITAVVNRNLDSSLFGPEELLGPSALTHAVLNDLVDEAVALGATEICLQGAVSGAPGYDYLDLIERIHRRAPELHLHAFRPAEVLDGAARLGIRPAEFLARLRDAGVGTVPGTGARILDERIRDVLSGHTDPSVESWADAITTAHRVGLRSTATMVYGHIETPDEQLAHLRRLGELQDETGGFTEFIALPFVPTENPLVAGARPGPSLRETRAVHAVARLLLTGRIANVQTAWTKLGVRVSQTLLQGGANDIGGLLLDGTLRPEAGAEAYRALDLTLVRHLAAEIGRPVRQRTTDYGVPAHPLVDDVAPTTVRMRLPLRERRAS